VIVRLKLTIRVFVRGTTRIEALVLELSYCCYALIICGIHQSVQSCKFAALAFRSLLSEYLVKSESRRPVQAMTAELSLFDVFDFLNPITKTSTEGGTPGDFESLIFSVINFSICDGV
jgi:hypothetical protein